MEDRRLIVAIKYSEHSNHFFIDFSDDNGYIISVKIDQNVAEGLSKSLDLKIMYG